MQQRRGTASQWTTADPVLAAGEIGVESDTAKFKIGDGINTWSNLDYYETATAAGVTFIEDSEKGANDGVATLDGTGNVPTSQLGNVDFTGYATEAYADQAEADAKSYTDTAIGNLIDSAPGTLDTLNELAAALGDDANFASTITTSLAGKSDVGHSHVIADITNLQSELDSKQDDVVTTQGDLVIGDVSGNPVRLPVGSADQVLTSDGNTVSFQDASSGSQTLIQSAVAQSGTSTSFTNLPQNFKHLMIVVTQNAGSNLFDMSMSDNRGDYLFVIIQANNDRRTLTDFFYTSSTGDIGQSTIFLYNYASAGITQAMAASAGSQFSSGTTGGFGSTLSSGNTSSLTFDFSQTCTKTIEIYGVN
jgi:hypothetical protein